MERFFTKVDGKPEMDKIRLRFDVVKGVPEDGADPDTPTQLEYLPPVISETITNTKSK